MSSQVFYEDVEVGTEIPPLMKRPTTRQLVKWAGAAGDYFEIHYDKDFAQQTGLEGVIVHGKLGLAWLGQLVTSWMGEPGTLKKLGCRYRGIVYPEKDMVCKGKVVKKYVQGGERYVECEVWLENEKGEVVTPGTAVVTLPSRTG